MKIYDFIELKDKNDNLEKEIKFKTNSKTARLVDSKLDLSHYIKRITSRAIMISSLVAIIPTLALDVSLSIQRALT